jgi:hypothetical protein
MARLGNARRDMARQGQHSTEGIEMISFRITMTGTAPLLMHNSRLANPLDPMTKALKKVTGKRTKTDDDHAEVARLEHAGSLYFDNEIGPYLPSDNIWRGLLDAAKKSKRGPRIKEGIVFTTDVNPISYRGPRTLDGLWADENFRLMASVKVGMSRVMRCRPMFKNWSTEAEGILDPNILDLAELASIAETGGQLIGIGDWRPRYGRYTATVAEIGETK